MFSFLFRKSRIKYVYCEDCRWFKEIDKIPYCLNPATQSTLIYRNKGRNVNDLRGYNERCGLEGKYWEPIIELKKKISP